MLNYCPGRTDEVVRWDFLLAELDLFYNEVVLVPTVSSAESDFCNA